MTGDLNLDVQVVRPDGFDLRVALHAPAGATTVVLGPNGAGKSTLLGVVAGLLPPTSGHVRLGSVVLDEPGTATHVAPAARRVGVVFQDGLLLDHLTVRDNVAFGPRARGRSRSDARALAASWLARAGCDHLAERRPPQLSGGEAQRVGLARALATDPQLLLLDEPLRAVDVRGRARLRRLLLDLLEEVSIPRLLVTHDPTEAFLLGDRLHVLEEGRLTQVGTPEEVRLRPATPWVADLVGTNLVAGTARAGEVRTDRHVLRIADTTLHGPVLLTIPPAAIALHARRPDGSPRNVWSTRVERVEELGPDRVRVLLGEPQTLTAEVTSEAAAALELTPGAMVHVSLKATEITAAPQEQGPNP